MSNQTQWPPKGFRPLCPEDIDLDEVYLVSLPQQENVTVAPVGLFGFARRLAGKLAGHWPKRAGH